MISKILNSKITKITAIILLPTVLVGGYYGVKWIIKKKKELNLKKKEENNNTLKDENI
jgi:hypothetical protein